MSRDTLFEGLLAQAARLPRPRELGLLPCSPPLSRLGRFNPLSLLGTGGMGTVYAATCPDRGSEVAIKVVHPHLVSQQGAERLAREAAVLAALDHPNVVRFIEHGHDDGHIYLVMQRVRGGTLAEWLRTPRNPHEIRRLLSEVASGLLAANRTGFIHRDFKPHNVLVDASGEPKIADFGLAKCVSAQKLRPFDTLTQTGTIVGTPAYMAPEQVKGGAVDSRTDQFAFCVTAWEALTGRHPFANEHGAPPRTTVEAAMKHRHGPAGWTLGDHPELNQVLTKGLQEQPANRHADLEPVRKALALP